MRVTAAVHRFINYAKQYEKCDPAARRCRLRSGEAKSRSQRETLNREPDNLSTIGLWLKPLYFAAQKRRGYGMKG